MRLLRGLLSPIVVLSLVLGSVLSVMMAPHRILAQSTPVPTETSTETPIPAGTPTPLTIFTNYPSQVIGIGETLNVSLKVRAGTPGVVALSVEDAPEGWTLNFRGGGRIVSSVYADGVNDATVDLRVEPPATVESGVYEFAVVAERGDETARLPLQFTVQEKLPPRLTLSTDLPTIRGRPGTNFRWDVTLENEGDVDLTANLSADAPQGFNVSFTLSGQDVTSVPLSAGESKRISVQANTLNSIAAGEYPLLLRVQGEDAQAELPLNAQVIGTADLSLTTPDGRLSGEATAGQSTPFDLVVSNSGSAPVRGLTLSANSPSGWTVTLEPDQIEELAPGQKVEVTANIQPAEKALTGDYVVTINARPEDGSSESVELRVTVTTSNLWGFAGVALIAVSVGVVGLAVSRFGRR